MRPRRRWLGWLAGLALLAGGLVITWFWARDHEQLRQRRQIISGLGLLCKLYAGDHDGAYPPDLPTLLKEEHVNSPPYLAYATEAVDYFPGATDKTNPGTVLIHEKHPDSRGRRWVCHADCSVEIDPDRPASP